MFTVTNIALALFTAAVLNILAAVVSWQRRMAKGGLYFAIAMSAVAFWTMAAGFYYAAIPHTLKILFTKLEYTGHYTALVFFVMFALYYANLGEWLRKKRVIALLLGLSLSNILLAWTNDWHGLLWSDFAETGFGNNTLKLQHGPVSLWAYASGFLLMLGTVLLLWLASHRGSEISRRQARMLLFAGLIPLAGNLLDLFQLPAFSGVDWLNITWSGASLVFLWVLYGAQIPDITPIAREKLVDSLIDGVIVVDIQRRIVDTNISAARMIGLHPEKLVGRNLQDFAPLSQSLADQPPDRETRTELEIGNIQKRYFDVLISPLSEGSKKTAGHLIVFRDITSRKQSELRLLQLNQTVEQSPTSVVITDLNGNISYVNPQFTSLTGYTFEEVIGKNPSILKSGQTPLETYQDMWQSLKAGKVWKGEFLNRKKNGDLYWEHATMAPVLNEDGQPINFIAVKADITERKKVEAALLASEERFRQLLMAAPDAAFSIDLKGRIVFANREASNLLGYEYKEFIGNSIDMLVPDGLREKHAALRAEYLSNPRTRAMGSGMELTARRKNGDEVPVEITLSYSEAETGPHVIAFMRDITDRKRVERIWKELATTDPLTGLFNRRHFFSIVNPILTEAVRYGHPLTVMLFDIDEFKQVNDTHGHAAGDMALQHLETAIRFSTRAADVPARFGGDEFIILLPNTDSAQAFNLAKRLRTFLSENPVRVRDARFFITLSIGIASLPARHETVSIDALIEQADHALYQAKQAGRDQIRAYGE